jgi:hypothetical protein
MLERAGTFGKYQKITTILWCAVGYLCGGLMLIIPYLFYEDPYVCKDRTEGCQEYACGFEPSKRGDFVPKKTFSSLANQFGDFRCP